MLVCVCLCVDDTTQLCLQAGMQLMEHHGRASRELARSQARCARNVEHKILQEPRSSAGQDGCASARRDELALQHCVATHIAAL